MQQKETEPKEAELPRVLASRRDANRRVIKKGLVKKAAVLSATAILVGTPSLMLLGATRSVQSAPARSTSGGWQTAKNTQLGFAIERPAGWTVRADTHSILVQSPDHAQNVLAEVFSASPGESAAAHLERLPEDHAALFPQAQVSGVAAQPSRGDEVAATLSYQAPHGAGQGRTLCFIAGGKGLLFVLAAPGTGFASTQPVLTRIVKSLRFTVPASNTTQAKGASAQGIAAVRGLHFVTWTDPREHGFHIAVPQGWKADGGVYRAGPSDVRIAYQVESPGKDMSVNVGDPRLPSTFEAPNRVTMPEGQGNILHYMPALEFNRWYLETFGSQVLDNLTVGAEHPLTEISRQRTAMLQQQSGGFSQAEASVGVTEFSGRSKASGKQVTGAIIGSTQRSTSLFAGGEITTWFGSPMIISCNDDASKVRNQQMVMAVFTRLMQTYREDPAWLSRRRQELGEVSQEITRNGDIRRKEIAEEDTATRGAIMGQFWGRVSSENNADDERQRGFINYLGDRTDVTDGSGRSANVQSGYKHYYENGQTGGVLGTDSAFSPGVDFTPLTEH